MMRSARLQRIKESWPRVAASAFLAATCASLLAPAADAQFVGTPAPAALRIGNDVVGAGPGAVSAAPDGDTNGICARTSQVREAILARIDGITDCADVTKSHLAGITGELDLSSSEIDSLSAGDFAGLSSVRLLNLYDNDFTTLPSGLLTGMSNLEALYLDNNDLTALPADLLVPVRDLVELWVRNNELTELPAGFFAGVSGLGFGDLHLYNNPGDPDLRHLSVCWTPTHCARGAPIPIEFSVQALGEGRFKVVVPIGTPFELHVALEVTNGTIAADTITIPIGRVESDAFTLTRAADATAAVTVDIVDLRATDPDPRNLRTRGGQEHVLPIFHAGIALVKADPPTTAAPVVTGSTSFTVTEGETVVGTLSATDEDTAAENLEWSLAGGADEGKFVLTAAGALTFGSAKDYENPDDSGTNGTYNVTVEVSDGTNSDTADVTVTLANRNEAPSADAGSDQTGIEDGAAVTLSGSGSDPDADETLSYAWSQTAGTSVTLASASSAEATFSAPSDLAADETLTFRLRVTDAGGLFAEDDTDVTVLAAPSDPDGTRAGATRLTATPRHVNHRIVTNSLDRAAGDSVDYYVFTLEERQVLGLGVRDQTIDLDATLEDASGSALVKSWPPPADATVEWLTTTLDSGSYYIRVEAAEDGATEYRIRFGLEDPPPPAAPVVSVVAVASPVAEGSKAEFRVSRTGPTTEDLTVTATWAHSDRTETTTTSLRFHLGRSTIEPYTHRFDDKVVREDLIVTLTLQDGEGYVVAEETASAQVVVEENDTAKFALSLNPAKVAEGASSTVRVKITNQVTFEAEQTIDLDFDGGTAARGTDYTVSAESLTLGSGASSADAMVTALEDSESEGDETVSVTASQAGRTIGTGTITIADGVTSDPDGTREGATRLTATPRHVNHRIATDSLDRAAGDSVDYYVFTLGERQVLGLGVRDQTIDLDATLEDASGKALMKSWPPPVDATVEWLKTTLDSGTYYIRVEAVEDGATEYRIRFGLEDPAGSAGASTASDRNEAEDGDSGALQLLGDVTPEAAAAALFGETELGEARLEALDRLGNANGVYDLGDLLSWRARCSRGEARCGRESVPAGAVLPGAIVAPVAAADQRRRTRRRKPVRRRSGGCSPRFRSAAAWRRTLVLALIAGIWGCGLGDDPVQPQSVDAPEEPQPGRLLVTLKAPSGARAAGAMIVIEGPAVDSLRAPGHELIQADESSAARRAAIVAGALGSGPVLEVWVPHVGDHRLYRARLLQVAGEDYTLGDPTEYAVDISR